MSKKTLVGPTGHQFALTAQQLFFYENAGHSYRPGAETPTEGRVRCACELADAETWAAESGLAFQWRPDDIDSSEFTDDPDPWLLWVCLARDEDGTILAALGGVDFGRGGEPWGDAYRRVVEAELASEARHEKAAA